MTFKKTYYVFSPGVVGGGGGGDPFAVPDIVMVPYKKSICRIKSLVDQQK
jgi:hypothetical protein